VHFGQPNPWLQEFHARPFELSRDRGAIPMVDMDPDGTSLAEIAAGDFDAQIAEWAAAARDFGGPLFLRWAWEMNGTWFQWGEEAAADPSSYVAVWRRLHDLIEAEGASNVTWVWCPSVVQAGATPLRALYPGDRYVDWNCMDGYNLGRSRPATNWHSFDEIFRRTYDRLLALAPEKPIVIGEVGSTAVGGSKPRWIRKALGTDLPRSYPRVKALVWFNWNILEDGRRRDWQIETSPESEAAFAESIASPYYAPPDYGDLPPLTPVPADPAAALP